MTARSATNLASLSQDLTAAARRIGSAFGIAVAPLDDDAEAIGDIASAVAWSTAKVPLAMAALTAHPGPATEAAVARAIRDSDNAAAQSLWDGWPAPARAAQAVTAVLRTAGDHRTVVPEQRRRDGFSIIGQTVWSLAAQAEFGARMGCLHHGRQVLAAMAQVSPGQQWGLADPGLRRRAGEVAVKGGWGPDPAGGYLVRQLAVVTPRRSAGWAAALAVRPASGRFTDGTAALTTLAAVLLGRLEVTGPRRCR